MGVAFALLFEVVGMSCLVNMWGGLYWGHAKVWLFSVPQVTEEMSNLLILPEFTLTRTEN